MKPLVAIVGPTGVGKSKLAIYLGQLFDGEIVGADSRQVYRYMDIGTAKPDLKERAIVPHHLIDVVDPDADFSLALYQEMAHRALDDIQERGKLALLVGGSGLYIRSVLEGLRIPQIPPNPELRRNLEARAQAEGKEALYRELKEVDPVAAQRIDPQNLRRVIRALEVCWLSGIPFSQLQQSQPPPFHTLVIGLTTERSELYRRIDIRVDDMINRGWVKEAEELKKRGYGFELPAMSGLGYKEISMFLQGKLDLPQAIQRIKFETHRFARQQYAWFRLGDERIRWFDMRESIERRVESLVAGFASLKER